MIAGVRIDTVDISELRERLAYKASGFANGAFTPAEPRDPGARPNNDPARHLAARFAVNEAPIRAWSASFHGSVPTLLSADIRNAVVIFDAFLRLAPLLHRCAAAMLCRTRTFRTHVSLSHDGNSTVAVVVLEASDGSAP